MPDRLAVLRLSATGGIPVSDVLDALGAIEHAYNSVWALLSTLEEAERWRRYDPFFPPWSVPFGARLGRRSAGYLSWPPERAQIATLVTRRERLILHAVRLESPGAWEFLGSLNPLEVLRQYLNDRHQRMKDRTYRDVAEQRKLGLENEKAFLENELLKNRAIDERIRILRDHGASDKDLAPLLGELLYKPLKGLERYQDAQIIDEAEIKTYEPSD